jgi:hypothetical protein
MGPHISSQQVRVESSVADSDPDPPDPLVLLTVSRRKVIEEFL